MKIGIQGLPPKMLQQFVDRAKRMDACVRVGHDESNIYEFAQGNNVVCITGLDHPVGHIGKDARRADEIRRELENDQTNSSAISNCILDGK